MAGAVFEVTKYRFLMLVGPKLIIIIVCVVSSIAEWDGFKFNM